MARQIERLTTGVIAHADRRGLHPHGAGLYLHVGPRGGRSWIYRYTLRGRTRYMGLGSAAMVSLREARRAALGWRGVAAEGRDPLEIRRQQASSQRKVPTFKEAAESYISANQAVAIRGRAFPPRAPPANGRAHGAKFRSSKVISRSLHRLQPNAPQET